MLSESAPVGVPENEPPDDLGTASLTVERLRRFLTDPATPAENAEAERRLNAIVSQARQT